MYINCRKNSRYDVSTLISDAPKVQLARADEKDESSGASTTCLSREQSVLLRDDVNLRDVAEERCTEAEISRSSCKANREILASNERSRHHPKTKQETRT